MLHVIPYREQLKGKAKAKKQTDQGSSDDKTKVAYEIKFAKDAKLECDAPDDHPDLGGHKIYTPPNMACITIKDTGSRSTKYMVEKEVDLTSKVPPVFTAQDTDEIFLDVTPGDGFFAELATWDYVTLRACTAANIVPGPYLAQYTKEIIKRLSFQKPTADAKYVRLSNVKQKAHAQLPSALSARDGELDSWDKYDSACPITSCDVNRLQMHMNHRTVQGVFLVIRDETQGKEYALSYEIIVFCINVKLVQVRLASINHVDVAMEVISDSVNYADYLALGLSGASAIYGANMKEIITITESEAGSMNAMHEIIEKKTLTSDVWLLMVDSGGSTTLLRLVRYIKNLNKIISVAMVTMPCGTHGLFWQYMNAAITIQPTSKDGDPASAKIQREILKELQEKETHMWWQLAGNSGIIIDVFTLLFEGKTVPVTMQSKIVMPTFINKEYMAVLDVTKMWSITCAHYGGLFNKIRASMPSGSEPCFVRVIGGISNADWFNDIVTKLVSFWFAKEDGEIKKITYVRGGEAQHQFTCRGAYLALHDHFSSAASMSVDMNGRIARIHKVIKPPGNRGGMGFIVIVVHSNTLKPVNCDSRESERRIAVSFDNQPKHRVAITLDNLKERRDSYHEEREGPFLIQQGSCDADYVPPEECVLVVAYDFQKGEHVDEDQPGEFNAEFQFSYVRFSTMIRGKSELRQVSFRDNWRIFIIDWNELGFRGFYSMINRILRKVTNTSILWDIAQLMNDLEGELMDDNGDEKITPDGVLPWKPTLIKVLQKVVEKKIHQRLEWCEPEFWRFPKDVAIPVDWGLLRDLYDEAYLLAATPAAAHPLDRRIDFTKSFEEDMENRARDVMKTAYIRLLRRKLFWRKKEPRQLLYSTSSSGGGAASSGGGAGASSSGKKHKERNASSSSGGAGASSSSGRKKK